MDYVSLSNATLRVVLAVFVIPTVGVIMLIALARALGFGSNPRFTAPADAAQVARDALLRFDPVETALGADGGAALVRSHDGRVALIRAHGDRWVVRVANGATVKLMGDTLGLRIDEPMFKPVLLNLGASAPHWAKALAA